MRQRAEHNYELPTTNYELPSQNDSLDYQPRTTNCHRSVMAFTLFEVLIALAVFAMAVTGLAMALESIVQTALEARERTLSRMELESRLAYDMVDPPIEGDRTLTASENHGFNITESATPEELEDGEGHPLTGLYRLKISSKMGNSTDSLETLIYHP